MIKRKFAKAQASKLNFFLVSWVVDKFWIFFCSHFLFDVMQEIEGLEFQNMFVAYIISFMLLSSKKKKEEKFLENQ